MLNFSLVSFPSLKTVNGDFKLDCQSKRIKRISFAQLLSVGGSFEITDLKGLESFSFPC